MTVVSDTVGRRPQALALEDFNEGEAVCGQIEAQLRNLAQRVPAARFQEFLLAVATKYGITSVPTLDNEEFVATVVFDLARPRGTPKARLAYLFPNSRSAQIIVRLKPDLSDSERERALALPEADEVVSHGMPCFGIIKGKKFAYVSLDHHGDGKTALLVKISGADEQAQLIENDPERYYRPAYFGDGWIAMRLDLGRNDWDEIGEWLARSWRSVAPRKLTGLMDAADGF